MPDRRYCRCCCRCCCCEHVRRLRSGRGTAERGVDVARKVARERQLRVKVVHERRLRPVLLRRARRCGHAAASDEDGMVVLRGRRVGTRRAGSAPGARGSDRTQMTGSTSGAELCRCANRATARALFESSTTAQRARSSGGHRAHRRQMFSSLRARDRQHQCACCCPCPPLPCLPPRQPPGLRCNPPVVAGISTGVALDARRPRGRRRHDSGPRHAGHGAGALVVPAAARAGARAGRSVAAATAAVTAPMGMAMLLLLLSLLLRMRRNADDDGGIDDGGGGDVVLVGRHGCC